MKTNSSKDNSQWFVNSPEKQKYRDYCFDVLSLIIPVDEPFKVLTLAGESDFQLEKRLLQTYSNIIVMVYENNTKIFLAKRAQAQELVEQYKGRFFYWNADVYKRANLFELNGIVFDSMHIFTEKTISDLITRFCNYEGLALITMQQSRDKMGDTDELRYFYGCEGLTHSECLKEFKREIFPKELFPNHTKMKYIGQYHYRNSKKEVNSKGKEITRYSAFMGVYTFVGEKYKNKF